MIFLLIIILTVLFLLFIILYLIIKCILYFKRRGNTKNAYLVAAIFISIIVFIVYIIYDSIYPSVDFYKDEFTQDLHIDFPKDGKVLYKDSSFPDHHGHYISACSLQFTSNSYNELKNYFDSNFAYKNITCKSDELCNILSHFNEKQIIQSHKKIEGSHTIYMFFLNDNKTILYYGLYGIAE